MPMPTDETTRIHPGYAYYARLFPASRPSAAPARPVFFDPATARLGAGRP